MAARIALFASAFYPSLGGVEELCRQLAHELKRQGHGVIILTNRWPRNQPEHELYEGLDVYRLAFRTPDVGLKSRVSYRVTVSQVRRRLAQILRQHAVDILHVQCVSSSAHYACWAKQRLRIPLVVTLQGELTMDATGLYQRSTFARGTLRESLELADAITACSRQTLDEARDFLGCPFSRPAQVIPNGIRLADFASVRPHAHPRGYIFAIGRHVPQKGFDVLLRAYALARQQSQDNLPDLILAGDGPERGNLEALARELQLGRAVSFFGRADRPQAVALFAGCEFFVLPSRHEPFGIVVLEAMAAGKAVIATRVGGVPEILRDDVCGLLVDPNSPEGIAQAIVGLASDAGLRRRLGAAGRTRAHIFDWSTIAEQYCEAYRSLHGQAANCAKAPTTA